MIRGGGRVLDAALSDVARAFEEASVRARRQSHCEENGTREVHTLGFPCPVRGACLMRRLDTMYMLEMVLTTFELFEQAERYESSESARGAGASIQIMVFWLQDLMVPRP